MRRANVQLQADRRSEILAAHSAASCARLPPGFDEEICAEAGMSPGGLYATPIQRGDHRGIAERDRADAAQQFAASTAPRLLRGIDRGAPALVERSAEEVALAPRSWRRAAATRVAASIRV